MKTDAVETPQVVANRIRRALEVVEPGQLVVNPDCGLRHASPEIARAKLRAMTQGAELVRAEIEAPSTAVEAVPAED